MPADGEAVASATPPPEAGEPTSEAVDEGPRDGEGAQAARPSERAPRPPETVETWLAALAAPDRDAAIRAAFQLGETLAGAAKSGDGERALAALEALAANPESGAWVRKRCKRAISKIRGW